MKSYLLTFVSFVFGVHVANMAFMGAIGMQIPFFMYATAGLLGLCTYIALQEVRHDVNED